MPVSFIPMPSWEQDIRWSIFQSIYANTRVFSGLKMKNGGLAPPYPRPPLIACCKLQGILVPINEVRFDPENALGRHPQPADHRGYEIEPYPVHLI